MSNRKIKPPKSPLQSPKIVLDWQAYFIAFCQVHGEPVESGGRLLYRDGWMYSSTNYEGPEFSPPSSLDDLDVLILRYWTIRQSILTKNIRKLQHQRILLLNAREQHSLPLQQVTIIEEDDRKRRSSKPLNLDGLTMQIQWISDDIVECNQRLREIKEYHETKGGI